LEKRIDQHKGIIDMNSKQERRQELVQQYQEMKIEAGMERARRRCVCHGSAGNDEKEGRLLCRAGISQTERLDEEWWREADRQFYIHDLPVIIKVEDNGLTIAGEQLIQRWTTFGTAFPKVTV
jgi:hypothetical protein